MTRNYIFDMNALFTALALSANDFKRAHSYPPTDLIKRDDGGIEIRMALAGFAAEQINVQTEGSLLTISAQAEQDESDKWIYKGIAQRSFVHKFKLQQGMQIERAEYKNGLLKIDIHRVIPEGEKPRSIPISVS